LAAVSLWVLFAGTPLSAQALPEADGWVPVRGSRVTVYHTGAQAGLAADILARLEGQRPLPGLPVELPRDVSAYLAPDEPAFARLTGGGVPEWGAAVAIPDRDMLVLPVYASTRTLGGDRPRVLRHEWAHLALHQYAAPMRIPRWFDEGYAEWAAGWDNSEGWRLRILIGIGRAPSLDSLTLEWPRDAASAEAAYMLSATVIEYLVGESGERGLSLFLERWKQTGSFDAALLSTYGETPGQLEIHWRSWVKRRYGWLLVISQSAVVWAVMGVLLSLLVVLRRRRNREKMARLRAGEVPDAPDYWSGAGGDAPADEPQRSDARDRDGSSPDIAP
jgi:hypothetical protein